MTNKEDLGAEEEAVFATDYLPFAAFLLATESLDFLGKEGSRSAHERVQFYFYDPDSIGKDLELEYFAGAEVGAADFYDAMRRCRKLMDMQG